MFISSVIISRKSFQVANSFSRMTNDVKCINILNVQRARVSPGPSGEGRYLRAHFRNDYRLALPGYRRYPFPSSASPPRNGVRRALGLHPTPIIPAETAQVPRPLRPTSARKISHPGHLPLLCLTAVVINF